MSEEKPEYLVEIQKRAGISPEIRPEPAARGVAQRDIANLQDYARQVHILAQDIARDDESSAQHLEYLAREIKIIQERWQSWFIVLPC